MVNNNVVDDKNWVLCSSCGKKLLKRKANGVFVFKFGRNSKHQDVVYIEVLGSIRIKCFRESCQHMNEITFFPN